MAASTVIPVEKLMGRENFNNWEFAIKNYLEHEDLWSCITGNEKLFDDDGNPIPAAADSLKKDVRARTKIVMTLHSSLYSHIRDCTTAKEVWTKVGKIFQDNGLSRRVKLMKKLVMTRLDDCSSMEDYVTQILDTAQMLNAINFKVSEDWVGTFLLAGLPEKFEPMIMAIENSGAEVTGDFVKGKLLMDPMNSACSTNSALFSKTKSRKPRCFKCNMFGHVQKNCQVGKEGQQ